MTSRYHVERRIDAPPERVWALLTDASTYRDWNRAVVSIEGTIDLGNTISLVSIVNPERTFRLHITDSIAFQNQLTFGIEQLEGRDLPDPLAIGLSHRVSGDSLIAFGESSASHDWARL